MTRRRNNELEPARRAKLPPGVYRAQKDSRAEFRGALDEGARMIKDRITQISEQFSRSQPYVRSQMFGGSKSARFARRALDVRLYDAYFHWKAKEMNDGLAAGEKCGLEEIRDKIRRERPNYKNRPAEEKKKWLDEYKAHKDATAREKRRSRRGEQLDAASSLKNVANDLDTLHMRTGIRSVVFAVRSDILSTTEPFMFCDDDFANFFSTALGKTPDQIARLLEMWSLHGASSLAGPAPKNSSDLKAETRKLITNGLNAIIAERNEGAETSSVKMNYESYQSDIVSEFGVRIVGWTMNNGILKNPGQLPMHELRALYKGLIDKSIHWEIIPDTDDSTPVSRKKRKVRADKGGTHNMSAKAAKTGAGSDAASSSRSRRKSTATDKGKDKAPASESDDETDDENDLEED